MRKFSKRRVWASARLALISVAALSTGCSAFAQETWQCRAENGRFVRNPQPLSPGVHTLSGQIQFQSGDFNGSWNPVAHSRPSARPSPVSISPPIRTLCMHAWAAISHYLDYKAEWDIPAHLRKGLNALSGLFYVADEQYERLYDARQESKESAESKDLCEPATTTPINLDTVAAFLQRKYPDRNPADSALISKLVRELLESEYRTVEEVESAVDSAKDRLSKEDAEQKKSQKVARKLFFNTVGAVRVSLQSINPKFAQAMKKSFSSPT